MKTRDEIHQELESAGHKLIRDKYGNIEEFVLDDPESSIGHDGPGCGICREYWSIGVFIV